MKILIILLLYQIFLTWQILRIFAALSSLNYRKFELSETERISPCTLRFKSGLDIYQAETGEPIDQITVLQYSNIRGKHANKR